MNLRWLILDYVDPQLNLTKAERRRIQHHAVLLAKSEEMLSGHKILRPKQRILPFVMIAFGWVPLVVLGMRPRGLEVLLIFATLALVGWIFVAWMTSSTWRPFVLRALHDLGYPVCVKCGYLLRGLGDVMQRCPECGAGASHETSLALV